MARELMFGEVFHRLDEGPGFAFGFAERDGYTGYVEAQMLAPMPEADHVVSARATHALDAPDIKTRGEHFPLSFGSRVSVVGTEGAWSEIATPTGVRRYVPRRHLRPLDTPMEDPVAVARLLLGAPYVWGGNCERGIDCSGLVQAALLACGIACPGDSDLQERMPGEAVALADLAPGDLIFWKGHVAMVSGENRVIHANAHHMAVVEEPMDVAIERIAASETGPVTSRLRVTPPRG